MGVKSCHRRDCDSIMCDTYIQGIGYICFDCQEDFKKFVDKEFMPKGDLIAALRKFMGTLKGSNDILETNISKFFEANTH